MNFISFIRLFIPLKFIAMYFLIKARNIYFLMILSYIFLVKIYNLVNKSHGQMPGDYKNTREKYIPKVYNVSFNKTFFMGYIDGPRRLSFTYKETAVIFLISTILVFTTSKLYGEKALDSLIGLLIHMLPIIIILHNLISSYYDIKSYKKYIEIYGESEREIDKFLIAKSILYLAIELSAIILMSMMIVGLSKPSRRIWRGRY